MFTGPFHPSRERQVRCLRSSLRRLKLKPTDWVLMRDYTILAQGADLNVLIAQRAPYETAQWIHYDTIQVQEALDFIEEN